MNPLSVSFSPYKIDISIVLADGVTQLLSAALPYSLLEGPSDWTEFPVKHTPYCRIDRIIVLLILTFDFSFQL